MSEETGDEVEGETGVCTQTDREEHEATHVPFRDWRTHCMMGRGRHNCDGLLLHEHQFGGECSNNTKTISNVHCGERREGSEHHEQCLEGRS